MPIRVEFPSGGSGNFKGAVSAEPSTPVEGDWYIDIDDDTMYIYYGGTWQSLHVLTPAAAAPQIGGSPMGLLLALTYDADA